MSDTIEAKEPSQTSEQRAVVLPPSCSALAETLAAEGVFKGFHGLEGFAECDAFWEQQPYGKRLYYGDGGADYLHRDVLRAAVRALKRPNSVAQTPPIETPSAEHHAS